MWRVVLGSTKYYSATGAARYGRLQLVIAQLGERLSVKQNVVGSTPANTLYLKMQSLLQLLVKVV